MLFAAAQFITAGLVLYNGLIVSILVLAVFIVITLLVALAASNSRNPRYLKQELKLTEQRQSLKYPSTLLSPTAPELLQGWRAPPKTRVQPSTNASPLSQTKIIPPKP